MSRTDALTQKQYDFVMNYIKNGFNAKQAALSAGYSPTFAHVKAPALVEHPGIKKRIEKAYQAIEAKNHNTLCMTIHDKAEVLSRIIYDILPKDPTKEPLRKHYPDAIKAIAELNKMGGDYAPDKRLSVTVDATKERLQEAKRVYEEY